MNLTLRLEKLKAEQAALEQRIAEQTATRNAILGAILPLILEHPAARKMVQTEAFLSRLTKPQREALNAVLSETFENHEMLSKNSTTDAGGVFVEQKLSNSSVPFGEANYH